MDYSLKDIEAFLEVVETGSVTRAASRLNIAKSVISERITGLETKLGAQLTNRSARGVTLTEKGTNFYDRARSIMSQLNEAAESLTDDDSTLCGPLRIAAPMSFGTLHLGPLLFPLLHNHPQLQLALEFDDRVINFLGEGYDLAIRIGHLKDSRLVAKRIAGSGRVVCCSPRYAQEHGLPADLEALAGHEAIGYTNVPSGRLWRFEANGGEPQSVAIRCRLVVNNGEAMRDAAITGLGLAVLPLFIAADALKSGLLVNAMPHFRPVADEIYAVYPYGRHPSRKVRAVIAHLREALAAPPWDLPTACCGASAHI